MINIKSSYANLIQPFQSKEKSRRYLHGFYVEPAPQGGVFIVATDGRRLACFHDATGTADKGTLVLLPKPCATQCKPDRRENADERRLLVGDENRATIAQGGVEVVSFISESTDGLTFPDWRRVVPPTLEDKPAEGMFNSKYLGDFTAIATAHSKGAGISLRHGTGARGAAFVLTQREDFFGLLMPLPNHSNKNRTAVPFSYSSS